MTSKRAIKEFNIAGNGTFKSSFIYDLRKQVKETCDHLSGERHFVFDRSKKKDAYRELDNILSKKGYPEISDTTYYNFFNIKPNKDLEGNEWFSFSEKTIAIFKDFVENYHPDAVAFSPKNENVKAVPVNYQGVLDSTIKKLLHNTYIRSKGYMTSIEHIEVLEDGSAIHTFKQRLEAITDITHIMREYRVFNNGTVQVLNAFNLDNNNKLQVYTHTEFDDYRSLFIVFDDLIKAGETINYQWTVKVENFLDEVIAKKVSHVDRRPSLVHIYKTIQETYQFPDIPLFRKMKVWIKRHPNPNMVNKAISPIHKNGSKYYQIDHADLTNFNIEIEVIFDNK